VGDKLWPVQSAKSAV